MKNIETNIQHIKRLFFLLLGVSLSAGMMSCGNFDDGTLGPFDGQSYGTYELQSVSDDSLLPDEAQAIISLGNDGEWVMSLSYPIHATQTLRTQEYKSTIHETSKDGQAHRIALTSFPYDDAYLTALEQDGRDMYFTTGSSPQVTWHWRKM